ncbi:MAG: hypothetical protein ACUVTL_01480 [Thermoproteota archaeon]
MKGNRIYLHVLDRNLERNSQNTKFSNPSVGEEVKVGVKGDKIEITIPEATDDPADTIIILADWF